MSQLEFAPLVGATINASKNPKLATRGMNGVLVHILTTSSLQFKAKVSVDDANETYIRVQNHKTGAWTAANTAITPSANDLYWLPSLGAAYTLMERTAGSGTVSIMPCPNASQFGEITATDLDIRDLTAATDTVQPLPSDREVTVTFSLDTSQYTANDVLADSQIVNSVVRANDAKGLLIGIQILDKDDNTAAAMDVYLLSTNVSMGTENSPISISDADATNIIGVIPIAATDWKDLINSRMAYKGAGNPPLPMAITPVTGTDDIYIALVTAGTPTQTASGITARLWFRDSK